MLIRKRWKRGVTSAVTVLVWQLISYSAAVYFYRALTPEGDVHLGSAALVSLAVAVVLGAVDGILTKFALRAQGR